MSIRDDKLPHRVVYWAPLPAGRPGQPTHDGPEEMAARWVPEERQVSTPTGTVITTHTTVWTERPVQKEGIVLKGTLADIVNLDVPMRNAGAYTVREVAEHDTVDGTDAVHLAFV